MTNELCHAYNELAYNEIIKNGVNEEYLKLAKQLKDISSQINNYSLYLTLREKEIYWYIDMGKYEYAIEMIDSFRKEMEAIKSERGLIISKLLLSSLYYMKQEDEKLIEINKEILEMPGLYFREELLACLQLVSSYLALEKYEETLKYNDKSLSILNKHIAKYGDYDVAANRSNYLTIEFFYCNVYKNICDLKRFKSHLDKAFNLLSDEEGFINKSKYYHNLAFYQQMTGDWEHCFSSFDKAIEYRMNGATSPILINKIKMHKAEAMAIKGDYDEAFQLMHNCLAANDSIYSSILDDQKRMIDENHRMEHAMFRSERIKKLFNLSLIIVGLLISAVFLVFVFRLIFIHISLSESKEEILEAYNLTKQADKQKEIFVENISKEIAEPLNSVVTLSQELANLDNELSRNIVESHIHSIKRDAKRLLFLINSILDLSRLESGMMKFHMEQIDIESFFKFSINEMLSSNIDNIRIHFNVKGSNFICNTDQNRLEKLFESYMQPMGYDDNFMKEITVSLDKSETGDTLININGSPLADHSIDLLEYNIQRNINQLVISHFNWIYIYNGGCSFTIAIPA